MKRKGERRKGKKKKRVYICLTVEALMEEVEQRGRRKQGRRGERKMGVDIRRK